MTTGPIVLTAPEDRRSPLSTGIAWAYRILTVGVAFTLPTLAGRALDGWWGATPWATIVGAVIGFALGMFDLMRMAGRRDGPGRAP